MKAWEEELNIYRLTPAPPKKADLQEYIKLFLESKDDTYLVWFLHYYEKTINDKTVAAVQDYAMYGHFLDIKQAYVTGLVKALQDYDSSKGTPFIVYKEYAAMREVHDYIRTMRTGFTIQSNEEYLRLRKIMRLYRKLGQKSDDETLAAIADKVGTTPNKAKEILTAGLRNTAFVEFYRKYADEDGEDGLEEIAADGTSDTEALYFHIERAEQVMTAFENLNYRERAIVSEHLGFCRECYATYFYDKNDLDESGQPKRKCRKGRPFIDLALDHGLASPDTADKTYRRALEKMKKQLIESNISNDHALMRLSALTRGFTVPIAKSYCFAELPS